MALVAKQYRKRSVAADRRTRRLLHGCVAAGRRPSTHNRAEPVREQPLGFHLVQLPGVPVDTLEKVTQNGRLKDRILLVRQIAYTGSFTC